MPFTQHDIHAIHVALTPVIGRKAWGAHLGYGATLGLNFGAARTEVYRRWSSTRGEWILWTDSSAWLIEDDTGVLAASEDPAPLLVQAAERLNGQRLLAMEISATNAGTTFSFEEGLVLRLFPRYMDPHEDQTHWILVGPDDQNLSIGPGTTWSARRDTRGAGFETDVAIDRFITLCEDAWPCIIDDLDVQRIHVDQGDRFDLRLRLHPQDRDDERRIMLTFSGVQHLNVAQTDVGIGIDYLRIEPVGARGWDGISYDVHNPGHDSLTFYCASFDVSIVRA